MFQSFHIPWVFWIDFDSCFLGGMEWLSRCDIIIFGIQRFQKSHPQVPFHFYFSWIALCFLCLRKRRLLFYSGTLYHLFHQIFFHISPFEMQSSRQGESQLPLPLWSSLHDTHMCSFELLKYSCDIYFLLHIMWSYISYTISSTKQSSFLAGTGFYIFIVAGNAYLHALQITGVSQIPTHLILCVPLPVGKTSLHNGKFWYENNNKLGLSLQHSGLKLYPFIQRICIDPLWLSIYYLRWEVEN